MNCRLLIAQIFRQSQEVTVAIWGLLQIVPPRDAAPADSCHALQLTIEEYDVQIMKSFDDDIGFPIANLQTRAQAIDSRLYRGSHWCDGIVKAFEVRRGDFRRLHRVWYSDGKARRQDEIILIT